MHGDHRILVGVGRFDLRRQREFRHQLLAHREELPGEGRDRGLGQAFARHDVVREADGLDLVVGTIGRAAIGAGGNFGRFIDRMVLRDRVRRIDGEEGRRAAILGGGGDRVRGDLAVDGAGREIGVGLLGLDRFGGFIGRELHDLDLGGIDAVLLQDHLEQIDVGLGAADHADAMAGELRDLGDLRRPSSCPCRARTTAPRRSCAASRRLARSSARRDRRARWRDRPCLPRAASALAVAPSVWIGRSRTKLLLLREGLRQRLHHLEVVAVGGTDRDLQRHRPHREIVAADERADDGEHQRQRHERRLPRR